ncbi:glycosyltransferase family 29 protein [Oceanibaculum pacificum]|uniref:Uncharacterized protein n=1 Tax=Oceanibaculum pacificum TaxID=580166 RepID=A0A154WFD8_9PROT|nr:hypothetical protein [Oceanibaculum pacificum]KZD12206.1 hypothetical protein AUP43_05215 [Oceanibaculum pacificum]
MPDNRPTLYWRGRRRQRARDWRGAAEAYLAALPSETDEAAADSAFRLGYAREKLNDLAGARDAYAQAVEIAPGTPIRHYRLGFVADALQEWELAARAYRAAIDAGGTVPNWFYRLGRALERLRHWEAAGAAYAAAIRRSGNRPAWQTRLMRISVMTGDWRDVAALYPGRSGVLLDAPADALTEEALRDALADGATDRERPAGWWQAAYMRLFNLGQLRAAYAAKRIAVRRSREDAAQGGTARQRLDLAAACIDQGDYAVAYSLLAGQPSEEAAEMAAGAALLDGRPEEAACLWRSVPADRAFRTLIEGRRVAIVGAANTGLEMGAEIDAADVVIRTNYLNPDAIEARAAYTGRRTDIAYYNFAFEEKNRDRILSLLRVRPLDCVVLHPTGYKAAAARYRGVLPVRKHYGFRGFYGLTAYAIPRILYDVLRFRPAAVRVYNSDFFLGKDIHYSGYLKPEDFPDHDPDFVFMMGYHDILRNFLFTQILHRRGYCGGDSVFEAVMALSPDDFLDRMSLRVRALLAASERAARP